MKRKVKPGYVGLIGYSYSEKDDKFLVHLPLSIKKDCEEIFCSIWATVKRRGERSEEEKGLFMLIDIGNIQRMGRKVVLLLNNIKDLSKL